MEHDSPPHERLRVLMVEDDPADAHLVRALLAESRHPAMDVAEAVSLGDALQALAEGAFDAVLLDLFLPDADALEAVEQVRARAPTVPIVVLTNHDDERLGDEAVQMGAQDYLVKSRVTPDALIRSLRYAVERGRREEADRAVRRAAEYFRVLIENSTDLITILEPDGTIRYESPSVRRMLGYAPEDLVGRNVFEYVHPDDQPRVQGQFAELLATAGTLLGQVRFRHGNGGWTPLESTGTNLIDNPAVAGIVVNSRDITSRIVDEQRERELIREQAARTAAEDARHAMAEILESITDGFFAFGLDWRLTYVNQRGEALLGSTREQLLGSDFWALYAPLRDSPVFVELRQAMTDRRSTDVEFASRAAPGRWYHLHLAPTREGAVVYARDISRRKKAQEALLEERRRLADAQRVAHLGSWEWDLATGEIVWSDEHYRLWGFEPASFMPTREVVRASTHPDDRGGVARLTEAALRAPGPFAYEYRVVRPDGEVRVMDSRGEVVANSAGKAVRVVGTSQDVTERKRQEQALSRTTAALEASMDGICIVSNSGVFEYVNRAKAHTFGYDSPEELLGQSWHMVYPPDEIDRLQDEILPLFALTGRWRGELLSLRKDGSIFPAAASMTRLEGSGWVAVDWDITASKQAEDELRRRGEMVRLLQMAATTANESATLDEALHRVIEQVCSFAHLAVGHAYTLDPESGELVPSNIWCTARPEETEEFREFTLATRFARGEGLPGRVFATGQPVWVDDLAAEAGFHRAVAARAASLQTGFAVPVRAGSEVVAVLEFFSELRLVPDRLLLETLANVGTQLGRVAERTRAERELRGAREEAERANRAKSEFLSRMSHELRTPLNAILGFGQVLEMEVERADDRESAEQILRAGRHLLGLIDEVLDIARIEAGQTNVSVEPVALGAVVAETLDLVRQLAHQHGIQVPAPEGMDGAPDVLGDPRRLKQVLLNLVSNAIKYNRPGGSVRISCERTPVAVRIIVADTGYGIAAEKLPRLFVPFDRLDATGVQGTGLGLTLSRGLMEAMGGSLGFDSRAGEGSRFWAELPVAPELPQDAVPEGGGSPEPELRAEKRRTVLVVEDNMANLRLIERVFQRRPSVRLLSAIQGSVALDLAREHRPDLVLLDLNLPDVSGDEILTQIRRDPVLRDVAVVMISGDAIPAQVQRLLDLGAQGYITKPFDIQELLRVVDEYVPDLREAGPALHPRYRPVRG